MSGENKEALRAVHK